MDIEKLKKSLEGHGFAFRYFETGAEAADYLAEQLAGKTVGIGGSKTVEAIGLYEKLQGKVADVAWQMCIRDRRIPARYEGYVHAAGMVLLLGLSAFVMYNDIARLIK